MFKFTAHNYFITEQAENNLYILIKREMRRTPYTGMKQPCPPNSVMGMDTVLTVKHNGKVAIGYVFELFKNGMLIQDGITNHDGMAFGLNVAYQNDKCQCNPQIFRKRLNIDINNRRCSESLLEYAIKIIEPKAPEDTFPSNSFKFETYNAGSEITLLQSQRESR